MKVNEFDLSMVAIDPANVAMVEFKLPKSAFSRFEVEGPEELGSREGEERANYRMKLQTDPKTGEHNYVQIMIS